MQSEADVRKVLEAADAKSEEHEDDMELVAVKEALLWVLGFTRISADQFIKEQITDPYL